MGRMRNTNRRAARRSAGLAVAALLLACALPVVLAADEDARSPVPDPAVRAPAVAELRRELREELKSKDPEAKRALARKLIERARAAEVDAVKRYVLLDEAAALAAEARDVGLALDATNQIAAAFRVQGAARGFAAVDAITRGTKETGALAEAAVACVDLTGMALAEDDPATAGKAIAAAKSFAKTAKLGGLVARAAEIAELVAAFRKASAAAEAARAVVATSPDDPAAREALGRFLAFGRGRWDEGLAHLAKSGNATLAELAGKDLAHAEDAAARKALADGWWDVAQKEKDPLARARMLARAAAVYEAEPADADAKRGALVKSRLAAVTYTAWERGVALTKDFSKDGPVSLALATVRAYIAQQKVDRDADGWRVKLPRFPEIAFGRGEEYLWRLDTSEGAITLRFFTDTAPKHVANFLYLTELGFFDGLLFHRVIPGFMAQGGCPKKDGTGDPGYTFASEFEGGRKHAGPGVLSMANTGKPGSDGSQFFITFVATPDLDGKHTVFGEVVDGMDVVKVLEAAGTPGGTPKKPLVIESARVSLR